MNNQYFLALMVSVVLLQLASRHLTCIDQFVTLAGLDIVTLVSASHHTWALDDGFDDHPETPNARSLDLISTSIPCESKSNNDETCSITSICGSVD